MKNYLITCATGGIASSLALELAQEHSLFLAARNISKLDDIVSSPAFQHPVYTCALDFFSPDSIDECALAIKGSDKFDGVVFFIPRIPPSKEVFPDDEKWQEYFNNYFILPLRLLRQIVEQDKLKENASIVFVSGISSKAALPHYSINNCLRSAWVGQAKTMALSLAEQGISVNTLSLGGVMTQSYTQKMEQKALDQNLSFEELMENEVSNIPLRKYASVTDVIDGILALLGPISNHMTGQNIVLDGGFNRAY
ncbi:SDR family oxidoreductase [Vibrio coralliilyticus]|uniref:SDR family oxidoreductase n=1 Tax=Vibrio coralliilyticus TaxID=190893 RepID=UPI001560130B|nr:SDR family oxidoreductase [Vibrio coralliilyticus]NRF30660.1 SDR family oxidoreductase [Vibrio coralliilyticus]NRF54214.1 SDR family oxidoreductase [Vibrio coralliilyticus]NRG05604.1 SDR family oxidoreductase [Vibrio coralliilyticus]